MQKLIKSNKNIKTKSMEEISKKWTREKKIDDFLGSSIFTGLMIEDALAGDSLLDRLNPEVREAFGNLMGEKADTFSEIRKLILEKDQTSQASVDGLINKIQGQYGENEFLKIAGGSASLAESGSQKSWDIQIGSGVDAKYVNVKIYGDADGVLSDISEVNQRIINGELPNIDEIDFAVNSEIFAEVKQEAINRGFSNHIYDIGTTRSELRDTLTNSFEKIQDSSILDNFFGELLSSTLSAGAIHAAANAFLYWKGAKEKDRAIEDSIYSTGISCGGLTTALLSDAIITELGMAGAIFGPIGSIASIGVGYGTRAFLKRVASRRGTVESLLIDFKFNEEIMQRLLTPVDIKKAS